MKFPLLLLLAGSMASLAAEAPADGRYLYVAAPGIRNYLEFGGHGVLVFDIDHDYRFVRRIKGFGLNAEFKPENVKGICASAATGRLYISTLSTLTCYQLDSDKRLWDRKLEGGFDRMSITPDGGIIVMPSLERSFWTLLDADTGNELKQLPGHKAAHNTVVSLDGSRAFLGDRRDARLGLLDLATREERPGVEFTHNVRPFTVNAAATRAYVCVDDLLGFEVGDLSAGRKIHRLEVPGYEKGPTKRHACPCHGIGLTPDEREVWLCDSFNRKLHVFDNTVEPPVYRESILVRDEPGWITFSLDGRHAWPSTGEVIDTATRKVVFTLTDEKGQAVHSEKMVEVQFAGGKVVRCGDQFGLGRKP